MIVTQTELIDLLRKLFEGLGYGIGEDDDCANVVAWLAMRSVPILAQLAHDPASFAPALRVVVLEESVERVVIDGNVGNVMGISADLLRYKRQHADSVTVIIKNSRVPALIVPYLTQVGGAATWADGIAHHAVSAAGWHTFPTTTVYPLTITSDHAAQPIDLFADRYHAHLENGLTVAENVWDRLKELARAILVPESEYSRQHGAG
jgi:hypothetical protein